MIAMKAGNLWQEQKAATFWMTDTRTKTRLTTVTKTAARYKNKQISGGNTPYKWTPAKRQ